MSQFDGQKWDCSQIENEEEEEDEDWQKANRMEMQWAEDEKLEEILEKKKSGIRFLARRSLVKGT